MMRRFIKKKRLLNRGFTLIELMAVLIIGTIITMLFLLQQGKFDSATLLRSLAYSVGLSVRQAQVYGTSVLQTSGTYAQAYGVNFTNTPGSYVIFADLLHNNRYDGAGAGQDAVVRTFKLKSGYSIDEFCVCDTSNTLYCSAPTGGSATDDSSHRATIQALNILFQRPNQDALFTPIDLTGSAVSGSFSNAYVRILGPDGVSTRTILVLATGQLSILAPNTALACPVTS